MKNKKKSLKFPNISRFITEAKDKLPWEEKKHFIYLFTVIFLAFVIFMIIDLRQKVTVAKAMDTERKQVIEDVKKWEKVVARYKDYKDGYLELATLEYKLGNVNKAKEYLNKALIIDPNSKEGRALEEYFLKLR